MTLRCGNPNTGTPIACRRKVSVEGGPCGVTHHGPAAAPHAVGPSAATAPVVALVTPDDIAAARLAWRQAFMAEAAPAGLRVSGPSWSGVGGGLRADGQIGLVRVALDLPEYGDSNECAELTLRGVTASQVKEILAAVDSENLAAIVTSVVASVMTRPVRT